MSRDDAYLLDIVIAGKLALSFIEDMPKQAFEQDLKTKSATLHQLLVMGEAVKRLSDEFKAKHSAIPFKAIAGTRDKIIHEYHRVDLEIIWEVLSVHIPALIRDIEPLIPRKQDP